MKTRCNLCHHQCYLEKNQTGFCGARKNQEDKIICSNYGKITALALDPIEKKPLRHFYPGNMILSVGSYGCNLRCPFCQNSFISMGDESTVGIQEISPKDLVAQGKMLVAQKNIGIAYTYNEPLISFEYVMDCGKLAHEQGLKNVLVSNGTISEDLFLKALPLMDAVNIDLKSFNEDFYKKIQGDLSLVKANIIQAAKHCHLEITTLIIPDENDSDEEMKNLSEWIKKINAEIPLHISRFFPCYHMTDKLPTSIEKIDHLVKKAKKKLNNVYPGNC